MILDTIKNGLKSPITASNSKGFLLHADKTGESSVSRTFIMVMRVSNISLSKVQKSFWSCTHVRSCQQYTLYINLHILLNIVSKVTLNIQESRKSIKSLKRLQDLIKTSKSIVSCYHMNCCLQKYTTHQFTYFIYYLFQDNFKNTKMM